MAVIPVATTAFETTWWSSRDGDGAEFVRFTYEHLRVWVNDPQVRSSDAVVTAGRVLAEPGTAGTAGT